MYKQIYLASGVRERDPVLSYLCKIFNHTYLFIYVLSLVCVQADLSSFRSQREEILLFLLVFKSFVNRFGVFVTFITIFSFSELVWLYLLHWY